MHCDGLKKVSEQLSYELLGSQTTLAELGNVTFGEAAALL